jgi:hypothetical protein
VVGEKNGDGFVAASRADVVRDMRASGSLARALAVVVVELDVEGVSISSLSSSSSSSSSSLSLSESGGMGEIEAATDDAAAAAHDIADHGCGDDESALCRRPVAAPNIATVPTGVVNAINRGDAIGIDR